MDTCLLINDAPIVASVYGLNSSVTNRNARIDLPTPLYHRISYQIEISVIICHSVSTSILVIGIQNKYRYQLSRSQNK